MTIVLLHDNLETTDRWNSLVDVSGMRCVS